MKQLKSLAVTAFWQILATLLLFSLAGCAPFRDSAYSDQIHHPQRDLNGSALSALGDIEADGKIRVAVFADPHQNYKELDHVVRHINLTADIDFVVSLGDVTNNSYNLEFDQFLGSYLQLQKPAFNVLGNHDALGAGVPMFQKVFGALNFCFESSSHRFIFFNSANLESPEDFDPNWLKLVVENSAKPVFIFTHIPLKDPERFTGSTAQIFQSVLANPKTQAVLNGHNHVYDFTMDAGTLTLQGGRVEGGQWLLLELAGNQLKVTRMESGVAEWATLKN